MPVTATRLLRTYRSSGVTTEHVADAKRDVIALHLAQGNPVPEKTYSTLAHASCSYKQPALDVKAERRSVTEDRVAQSRLYAALDQPAQAANLICRDVACLPVRGQIGGLRLFDHRKRPTVFARIVGRIVGIEEKERRITWLVDDGSAVVAVHHPLFREAPVQQSASEFDALDRRDGKRKAEVCGIPSEYLRPVEPLLPPKPRHQAPITEESRSRAMRRLEHLSVGKAVLVVGRLDTWSAGGGERFLIADRAIPLGRTWRERAERAVNEGYIILASDPDDEARHMIEAIRLADTEYAKPFPMPNGSPMAASRVLSKDALLTRVVHNHAQSEATLRPARLLRMYGSGRSDKAESGTTVTGKPTAATPCDNKSFTAVPTKRPANPARRPSITARAKKRQLRDFRKLPDASMNEDTLRVYVEKHLRDHCGAIVGGNNLAEPPAFSIAYLASVAQLSAFAERVVRVALQERSARRRRQAGGGHAPDTRASPTHEAIASKCEALFACIVRTLLGEGTIVVANRGTQMLSPHDGRQPDISNARLVGYDKTAAIDSAGAFMTAKTALFEGLDTSMALDPDTSHFWRRRAAVRALGSDMSRTAKEAYQVVTPALLARPLQHLLKDDAHGYSAAAPTVEHLTTRLKALDERWRYITSDSVDDALALL